MKEAITQRITKIAKLEKLSINGLSTHIGVSQSTIATALNREKGIGNEIIEKIIIAFPHISAEWLITGKGEMQKNAQNDISQKSDDEVDFLRDQIREKDFQIKELLQTINNMVMYNQKENI